MSSSWIVELESDCIERNRRETNRKVKKCFEPNNDDSRLPIFTTKGWQTWNQFLIVELVSDCEKESC